MEAAGIPAVFDYMTPESINMRYLKRRVKALNGICRKCSWAGVAGAPDWLVMFPDPAGHCWIELKAPGEKPRPLQVREQEYMRQCGCVVYTCDSPESIDRAINDLFENHFVTTITFSYEKRKKH